MKIFIINEFIYVDLKISDIIKMVRVYVKS